MEAYYRDKLSLCSQPGAVLTVANGDDEVVRAHRDLLGPRVEWVTTKGPRPSWVEELGLLGRHNHMNALIAQACVGGLGVPSADDDLANLGGAFQALPSRLRPIGTVEGVTFVDDSLSTNVLPTLAAMSVFEGQRVALIVGGYDRHIDYAPLAGYLADRPAATLVLGLPQTGGEILAALEAIGPGELVDARGCDNLGEAVQRGFEWARPDGVVLLSPAAASFGQFRDYKDRAAAFFEAMTQCGSPS